MYQLSISILVLGITTPLCFGAVIPEDVGNVHRTLQTEDRAELADEISKWVSRLTQDWITTTVQSMGREGDDGTIAFSKKIYPIDNHTTVEKYCVSSKEQTSCVEVGIMKKIKAEIPIQVRVRRDVVKIHDGNYEDDLPLNERHSEPSPFNNRARPNPFGFNPDKRDEDMEPISKIREALPHTRNPGGQLEKLRDLNRGEFQYSTQNGQHDSGRAPHQNAFNDPRRGSLEQFRHHPTREDGQLENDSNRRNRPGYDGEYVRSPVSYNDKNFGKFKYESAGKPPVKPHQHRFVLEGGSSPYGIVRTERPSLSQFGSGHGGPENPRNYGETNRDYNFGKERQEFGIPQNPRNDQENYGSQHSGPFNREMNQNAPDKYAFEGSTDQGIPYKDSLGGSKNHEFRNIEDVRPRNELTRDNPHYMVNKNVADQLSQRKHGTEFQRLSTEGNLNNFNDHPGRSSHHEKRKDDNYYYHEDDDYESSKLENPVIEPIGKGTYDDESFQSARKPLETEYMNVDNGEDEIIAPNGIVKAPRKQPSAEDIFNHLIGKRSLKFDGEFRKHEKYDDDYGRGEGYGNAKLLRSLERGDDGKKDFSMNKKELNSVLDFERKSNTFSEEDFSKVPQRGERLSKGNLNINKYDDNFEGGRDADLRVEQASKAYNQDIGNQRNYQIDSPSRRDNNYEHYQQNRDHNRLGSKPENEREHNLSDLHSIKENEREHNPLDSQYKQEHPHEYHQSDSYSRKENNQDYRQDSNSRKENEREHYPLGTHSDSRKENERERYTLDTYSDSIKEYNREQQQSDSYSRKENEREHYPLGTHSDSRKENERERYPLDTYSDSIKEYNREQQQSDLYSRKENERELYTSDTLSDSRKENKREHYPLDTYSDSIKEYNREQQRSNSFSRKENEREHYPSNLNRKVNDQDPYSSHSQLMKENHRDEYSSDSHSRKEINRDDHSLDLPSIKENKQVDYSPDSNFRKENIREPASEDDPKEYKIKDHSNEFNHVRKPSSPMEKNLGNFEDVNIRSNDAIGDFGKQDSSLESPVKYKFEGNDNTSPTHLGLDNGREKYDFSKSNEKPAYESVKKTYDFGVEDDVLEDNFTEDRKSLPRDNFNTYRGFGNANRFLGGENHPGKNLPDSVSDWGDISYNKGPEENPINAGGFGGQIGEEQGTTDGIFEEYTDPSENKKGMMDFNDDPIVRRRRSSTNVSYVDERKDFHLCRLPKPSKTYEAFCKMLPKEAKCNLYCIQGHTFPEGIMKQTSCSQYTGKWTTRFDECKPFVDCSLRLKSAGSLDCEISSLSSGKKCSISCTREGVFDEAPLKEYECQLNGKWSPPLPHCVESDGVSLVRPPAVREIKDFTYP